MPWQIYLANLVVFVHVLFVAVVVVSVPLILIGRWRGWAWIRNFWFRLIHLLMMSIVVAETACGITCPLTTWERDLRIAGGQLEWARYDDGELRTDEQGRNFLYANQEYMQDFTARVLRWIIFLEDVPPSVLNICYYLFGALVLATLLLVPPRWPRKPV